MRLFRSLIYLLLISCSGELTKDSTSLKPYNKPSYIHYKISEDSIVVSTENTFKVPVHLTIDSDALSAQQIHTIQPSDTVVLLRFARQKIDTNAIGKNFLFRRYYGDPTLQRYDTLYKYQIPITRGKNYKILQGYNGSYSHNKPSSRYAIDIAMPIGDTIVAARDGIVLKVVEKYKEGGRDKRYYDYANSLLVYHKDGTFAQYVHLDYMGVLVEKGDRIREGQAVALSGNTGWSTRPHLHFSVYKPVVGTLVSIPVYFNKVSGFALKKGNTLKY